MLERRPRLRAPMRALALLGLVAAVALFLGGPAARTEPAAVSSPGAAAPPAFAQKHILVLYSSTLLPSYRQFTTSFTSHLDSLVLSGTHIHVETLEAFANDSPEYRKELRAWLKRKYDRIGIGIVVTAGTSARDFLLGEGADLFPQATVIATLCSTRLDRAVSGRTVIEFPYMQDIPSNLRLIRELFPATKYCYVVVGSGAVDRRIRARVARDVSASDIPLEVVYSDGKTLEDILSDVSRLPSGTVVLYITMYKDASGRSFVPISVARQVASASRVPVFGTNDLLLDAGVLGGAMRSPSQEGMRAAQIVLKIHAGEDVASESGRALSGTLRVMFNWDQLKRWKVDSKRLPPGAVVVHKPVTLWTQYRDAVIGAMAVIAILVSMLVALVLQNRRRKRAEIEVIRARNAIANILDSMPSVLAGVDGNGTVTHWNKAAEATLEVTAAQALGRPVTDVFPRLAPHTDDIHASIADGTPRRFEREVFEHDGRLIHTDVLIYPLLSDGMGGAVIRMDDVSQRVRLEEMMLQNEKMLSLGGLAAGMAHEINNPLSGIVQNAQVAIRRLSPNSQANTRAAEACGADLETVNAYVQDRNILGFLHNILEAADRAVDIVSNTLDFSRKSTSQLVATDLNAILDKSLELARADYDLKKKYDFKQIAIRREYASDLPKVPCNPTEIVQVILNLLKNAAQALTDDGQDRTRVPSIRLRTAVVGAFVRIEVEDNGPGMDESVCRRVFEPFFTTKPSGEGTGLGMSVSYFIITTKHNGRVEVRSAPGKGTCFVIHLPLRAEGVPTTPPASGSRS